MSHDPARTGPSIAAFDALDGLPIPLVVRARNGRLRFVNECARERLGLESEHALAAGLTRLGPPGRRTPCSFALTVERTILRRVDAHTAPLPEDGDEAVELLVLAPVDADDVAAGRALLRDAPPWASRLESTASELLDRLAKIDDPDPDAPRGAPLRRAAAEVIRRVRRRRASAVALRIRTRLPHNASETTLNTIAATELVLSAWELITSGATGGAVLLDIAETGGRLRFTLDAQSAVGGGPPDLRSHRALLRSLRPSLERIDATFEVHTGPDDARRVAVTLPTHVAPEG